MTFGKIATTHLTIDRKTTVIPLIFINVYIY